MEQKSSINQLIIYIYIYIYICMYVYVCIKVKTSCEREHQVMPSGTFFKTLSFQASTLSKFVFMSNFQFIECVSGVNMHINYLQVCTNCIQACTIYNSILYAYYFKILFQIAKISREKPCSSAMQIFVRIIFHLPFHLLFFSYFGL